MQDPWEPPAHGYDPTDPTLPLDPIEVDGKDRGEVEAILSRHLPHYGSPELAPVQFAEVYARLVAVSVARAEFYGAMLNELVEHHRRGRGDDFDRTVPGLGALIGYTWSGDGQGGTVATGEAVRALAKLESEERDRAAKLTREGIRMGLEAKQADVMRGYGRTVVEAMRQLCGELGVDWSDAATRRAAQRAVLGARAALGVDVRSPAEIGPPLTPEERRRAVGR
jgi:hypothetical protein